MCQQGGQTLNFCPLQSWHHPSKQRRLTFAVENHWVAAGGFLYLFLRWFLPFPWNRKTGTSHLKPWFGGRKIHPSPPWKLDWRRVAGHWLTKLSNQCIMKSKRAQKRTSTVHSLLLLLYKEPKICLACSSTKHQVLARPAASTRHPPCCIPPLPPFKQY